jgi:branched-chain amino acid transport system substrate-binding protein
VGIAAPLSGPAAEFGVAIKNGIEMALRDTPPLRERLNFIFEDIQSDIKLAVSAHSKLSIIDKVDLVVVWGLGQCRAVAPIAERHKQPLIALCLDRYVARDRPHVMRFQSSVDDYMRTTTEWLAKQGLQKLGVVTTESTYIEAMFEALERQLQPGQSVKLIEQFPPGASDFRATISKMQRQNFDAVGVLLAFGQPASFARQYRQMRGALPFFGTNVFANLAEVTASRGALESAIFAEAIIKKEFETRYLERFRSEAQLGFGALAYELISLVGEILHGSTTSLSGIEVLKRLSNMGKRKGAAVPEIDLLDTKDEGKHINIPTQILHITGGSYRAETPSMSPLNHRAQRR